MVALNTAYAPSKTLERPENRVGDFFCEGTDRLGTNRLPTRNRTGENGPTVTIIVSCRSRWLSRDPIAENGGINLYAYVLNDPINQIDPLGLWNFWNPLTYGTPSLPGENPWNPVDSSAHWGATAEGATKGAAAYADGINPFGNPWQDLGVYDPCKDKGTGASQWLGKNVGRNALYTAAGAGVASKFSGPLSRLPGVGKGSSLFGRGGQHGAKGIFNSGKVRTGWSWKGTKEAGRDVFRTSWAPRGGGNYWNHLDWF